MVSQAACMSFLSSADAFLVLCQLWGPQGFPPKGFLGMCGGTVARAHRGLPAY